MPVLSSMAQIVHRKTGNVLIEGLLVSDLQTSESLCCVLELIIDTGIKQKDKKSSQPDSKWLTGTKNIKANRHFTRCLVLDPPRLTHPDMSERLLTVAKTSMAKMSSSETSLAFRS